MLVDPRLVWYTYHEKEREGKTIKKYPIPGGCVFSCVIKLSEGKLQTENSSKKTKTLIT
jgi:hypothetical protein